MTKTILIVEDDELLRDLTAESLSSLYAVTITSTAMLTRRFTTFRMKKPLHW